ncbi:hypothetical protein [Eudoraea sp.]|uniref:hypothetical protein n=1 Tax=Eudoraea sp. TaxID=1979955 RepID=UPI003C73BC9A
MKNLCLVVLFIILLLASCEAERLNNSQSIDTFEVISTSQLSIAKSPIIIDECLASDVKLCPGTFANLAYNLWWPENINDSIIPNNIFSSSDRNTLLFTEYHDGSARLMGTTKMGSCILSLEIWFKDQMESGEWSGKYADPLTERSDCKDIRFDIQRFYLIDEQKSTIRTIEGDCGFRGLNTYGIVQRKEASSPSHYGSQLNFNNPETDSIFVKKSLSSRAWVMNQSTGELLWPINLDFHLECAVQSNDSCQTAYSFDENIASCLSSFEGLDQLGWVLGPLNEGDYSFDMFANTANCDITDGESLGTVAVSYESGEVLVTYNINKEYELMESNTYAGKNMLPLSKSTNTVQIPGEYSITKDLHGEIYIITHAVVCLQ